MTTIEQIDTSLPLKKEREEFNIEDINDDSSLEDINNLLSISLPSLSANKLHFPTDPNDEFLRLTTTVRSVYFSYLHKCLLTNYILCYKDKNEDIPCDRLKKCANQMELYAVRSSLEATLYRQNMLKLISDVKSHTIDKKTYKKLVIVLETPPTKVDIGVQTMNSWAELERADNIQSICITSNCEELSSERQMSPIKKEEDVTNKIVTQNNTPEICGYSDTASPIVNSTCFDDMEDTKLKNESDEETTNKMELDDEQTTQDCNIFNRMQDDTSTQITQNQFVIQNDDENSQDSLLQHMEDMFCDSDDSSDLMTLIEKHSGVSKANMDKEINKICLETDSLLPYNSNDKNCISESKNGTKSNLVKSSTVKQSNISTGKYSFSYYKEMKSREANKSVLPEPETPESKQKRRANSIWFVERVCQVSKLKTKMTELSLNNYRKYGRVKQKFVELFGESDDEETMPESPICIEDHLTACKERIAPWIVKHLMPFYKKRRIKDRQLFKLVAKHIADMLIIENTFPEPDCVSKYIETYFKNKKFIRTKQDVYL
ncbi:uncharacterized protein LOC128892288 [Hylaeus anthracinus]|uniref:uncharacterized protein LOC128892288 n=1 Tax=Hylaeus anthracinus TaxID=313031 RepID=UPI0023B8D6DC|nr:uncharacterized protein LOC128892288 [Hylaeus anthracinus]